MRQCTQDDAEEIAHIMADTYPKQKHTQRKNYWISQFKKNDPIKAVGIYCESNQNKLLGFIAYQIMALKGSPARLRQSQFYLDDFGLQTADRRSKSKSVYGYIRDVAVRSTHRKCGLGTKMMKYLVDQVGLLFPLGLHVNCNNKAAVFLYRKCGVL